MLTQISYDLLIYWGWVTHICICKPCQHWFRQWCILNSAGWIGLLERNFSKIFNQNTTIFIQETMKILSAKWRQFCLRPQYVKSILFHEMKQCRPRSTNHNYATGGQWVKAISFCIEKCGTLLTTSEWKINIYIYNKKQFHWIETSVTSLTTSKWNQSKLTICVTEFYSFIIFIDKFIAMYMWETLLSRCLITSAPDKIDFMYKPGLQWTQMSLCIIMLLPITSCWKAPQNTVWPDQNGLPIAEDILKWIFLDKNDGILMQISLSIVPQGSINKSSQLVQVMAWCSGSKLDRYLNCISLRQNMFSHINEVYIGSWGLSQ